MSDARDAFRAFARDLLPRGAWWRGEAAERFLDGFADAFAPTIELLEAIPDIAWPWAAERPVLEQWHDYLAKVACVATPALLEDLRTRVLDLLRADPTVFPDGLESTVLAYLPLVELDDQLPLSILGYNLGGVPDVLTLPFNLDPAWAVVEVWYPPTLVTEEQAICVARPFIPGVAVPRPVAPYALFHNPSGGTQAGDFALHWVQMRDSTKLTLQRRLVFDNSLVQQLIVDPVDVEGRDNLSTLLGLPGVTNLAGQRLIALWERTWADQTSKVLETIRVV